MSTMVYGPPFAIDGPLPVAPPYRLLDMATILGFEDPHWQNGVQVYPFPPDMPDATTPCLDGTFRDKEAGDGWPLPIFGPFTVYLPESCSSMSIRSQEEFKARAELVLAATESFPVERQLATGLYVPTNPYIGDANVTLLNGGNAADGQASLALLEDAIGRTGRQGMIHATPSIVSSWDATGYTLIDQGGRLMTRRGTPVVVGDGYIDTKPDGTPALGDGEAYAYATGPVQVMRSEVFMIPELISEALDRETNLVTYRAERTFVVDWDTDLQAAVLVDWSA